MHAKMLWNFISDSRHCSVKTQKNIAFTCNNYSEKSSNNFFRYLQTKNTLENLQYPIIHKYQKKGDLMWIKNICTSFRH